MPIDERSKFYDWPTDTPDEMDIGSIKRLYERGFAGCEFRKHRIQEERDKYSDFIESQGPWSSPDGDSVAHAWKLAGSGAGKLSLIFPAVLECYPGCLPGPAQQRGDCVSHGQKNANLGACCAEVVWGTVDQETGTIESAPEIPIAGIRSGAFSSSAIYWYRGHGSDGWYCPASAIVSTTKVGCVVNKNYPDIGLDLTTYSGRLAGTYGRTPPPAEITDHLNDHLIRTSTTCNGWEQVRDFIANGYPINSCGGEGWSSTRDENGVSRRSGSWSHAMAILAVDDRKWAHDTYGGGLVLIQNSWGRFNSGPRRIHGTSIDIPEGSFWAMWSDVTRRNHMAMSSVKGWPPKSLPNWVPEGII